VYSGGFRFESLPCLFTVLTEGFTAFRQFLKTNATKVSSDSNFQALKANKNRREVENYKIAIFPLKGNNNLQTCINKPGLFCSGTVLDHFQVTSLPGLPVEEVGAMS
jgi:hypothetical protein